MKFYFKKIAGTCLLFSVICGPSQVTFAQSSEARQFRTVSGQLVNEAQGFAAEKRYSEAIAKLKEALVLPNNSDYEISAIHSIFGHYYIESEQMDLAVSSFEAAISSGGLLSREVTSLEKQIALILISNERYSQGAQRLEAWIAKTKDNDPKNVEYIMQAWLQAENYQNALPWAEKWFKAASPKNRKHFDLLNYIYHNLGLHARQADLIKKMIGRWPDERDLWENWVSLLTQSGREKDAFEVRKIMYQKGILTDEADIKKVVEYHQYYEMPFQAALILEQEMKSGRVNTDGENLVRLSELFRQAREYERAIPILERAAKASDSAQAYAQLGEALYNEGQCKPAETNLKTAMDLGYDRGKAWSLIANCWYEQGQLEPRPVCEDGKIKDWEFSKKNEFNSMASAAFKKVPATTRSYGSAQKWLDYISSENSSYENYCVEIQKIERDLCFIKIESSYTLSPIRGGFVLAEKDQYCMKYKEEYDLKYRAHISD